MLIYYFLFQWLNYQNIIESFIIVLVILLLLKLVFPFITSIVIMSAF